LNKIKKSPLGDFFYLILIDYLAKSSSIFALKVHHLRLLLLFLPEHPEHKVAR
jgi:hypothetical protein